MFEGTRAYIMELLGDEHRRILQRGKSDYVTGRTKGIEKFASLVQKYWDTDWERIDSVCDILIEKAKRIGTDTPTGFIRSIERCQTLMRYIQSGMLDIEFPTPKQLFKIKQIEENGGPEFTGVTRSEASSFISDFS